MDKRKMVIFDFDGTIADTIEAWFSTLNSLSSKFNYSKIDKSEIEALKNKGVKEILREKRIPLWKLGFLLRKARLIIEQKMKYVNPMKGIPKIIETAKSKGYLIAIITSNSKKNVETFLSRNSIKGVDYIEGGGGLFSKHAKILKLLRTFSISPAHAFYIGDEVRDIEAARKAGVKAIAVTWGFNSSAILLKSKPDHLINNPQELIKLISTI